MARPLKRGKVSDRALRYRAQRPGFKPEAPKQCGLCGSRKNVVVAHINGFEEDGDPQNLMWQCKRCNGFVGGLMKREGLGRRVVQMNPPHTRRAQMNEYAAAIKVMRGEWEGDLAKAVSVIRATPRSVRSAYTSRTWSTRRAIYGPSGRAGGGSDVPF